MPQHCHEVCVLFGLANFRHGLVLHLYSRETPCLACLPMVESRFWSCDCYQHDVQLLAGASTLKKRTKGNGQPNR